MKKLRIGLLAGASLLIVSILLIKGFGGQTIHAASTSNACGSWSVVPSPNIGPAGSASNELYSVATSSSNDAWAVGSYSSSTGYPSLAEHWDGSQWSIVASANVKNSRSDTLSAVTELSANNVWAVGNHTDARGDLNSTLIEHWNGSRWRIVASPNVGSNGSFLSGIAAVSPNDIWAVGQYYNSSFAKQTLTEHWDGSSWSIVSSPSNANGSTLSGVTAISSSDVWAVGSTYPGTTLTEHWNGSQWSAVSSPSVGNGSTLSSVTAVSSSDVWAVGTSNIVPHQVTHTLIEQWNGTSWNVVTSPNVGAYSNTLDGVAAVSANTIWAVGNYDKTGHEHWQALIEQWNGTSWNAVASPKLGHQNSNLLYSAAAIPGTSQVWAVGAHIPMSTYQYRTLTEYYC